MASFPETAARKLLLRGGGAGAGDSFGLWELVKAKATEIVVFLAGLLAALAGKAETLFPPDARSETLRRWVHVAVMVALPAVVGALAVHCLGRCCCAAVARRREGRRMMVAPGRGGARMPRDVFEDDPRGYFRSLRDRKPLVY